MSRTQFESFLSDLSNYSKMYLSNFRAKIARFQSFSWHEFFAPKSSEVNENKISNEMWFFSKKKKSHENWQKSVKKFGFSRLKFKILTFLTQKVSIIASKMQTFKPILNIVQIKKFDFRAKKKKKIEILIYARKFKRYIFEGFDKSDKNDLNCVLDISNQ